MDTGAVGKHHSLEVEVPFLMVVDTGGQHFLERSVVTFNHAIRLRMIGSSPGLGDVE